jgi:hypothetical protein
MSWRWLALYAVLVGVIAGATCSRAQMWQPWTHGTPAAGGSVGKWNTADKNNTNISLSTDQLTATAITTTNTFSGVRSTTSHAVGEANKKWYFEVTLSSTSTNNAYTVIGIANSTAPLTFPGSDLNGTGLQAAASASPYTVWYLNGTNNSTPVTACIKSPGPATVLPETMGFVVDFSAMLINCTLDGAAFGATGQSLSTLNAGPYFIMAGLGIESAGTNAGSAKINTGPTGFVLPVLGGYTAWQ